MYNKERRFSCSYDECEKVEKYLEIENSKKEHESAFIMWLSLNNDD